MMKTLVSAFLVVWGGLYFSSTTNAAEASTNVILFLVDDMGWADSEPYGSTYYETPNMTRLARQSMRFSDAYALPLCSPTRASIMTGQYSSRHGITSATGHQPPQPADFAFLPKSGPANQPLLLPISKNYLDPAHHTLAEALRDAGYRTGHFGKWHLGLTDPYRPEKHGFDVAWHCAPDPGPPSYFSPYGVHPDGVPGGQHRVGNITDGPDGEHITDRLTSEAIQFIKDNRGRPFFLNLWHYSVHGPWQHKESYTAEFAKKNDPRGMQANPVMGSMLRNVDESLGRILDVIDELGIADNTLFIFYSDNGGNTHSWRADDAKIARISDKHPLFHTVQSYRRWAGDQPPTNNAPLREGKGRIYEGGQRVPLMVRWPGHVRPGSTSDQVVGPIDLYPTILDALGLTAPQHQLIDGESFLPVLTESGKLRRDAYFTWFPHLVPAVSVRQGDWKLIRRFQPHPQYPEVRELYNLQDDISESENRAADFPERVKQLDALIDQFVEETGALYPQPNPNYRPGLDRAATRSQDSLFGLVPKFCEAKVADGVLRVEATGSVPFLGTARVKHDGPVRLNLRIRSETGGAGKVSWKTAQQEAFPAEGQQVDFAVSAGNQWQDIELTLPIQGPCGIVRLYLPLQHGPVELQLIEFHSSQLKSNQLRRAETSRRLVQWNFADSE